ncbi:hypothetical protein [Streptomyces sp. CB03234]|uniref:hypothetical protein n=1 Tax=Streptomyces sp. (strain CB03234) TaxID=1703937 RepID=UPI001180F10C|nr:hypothetical protein [Streptomyces sp. CB03234]
MDVSSITYLEIDGQDMTDYIQTKPTSWTKRHQLHVRHQVESRPGPAEPDGTQWIEHRATGMVHLLCNCGYTSGWIPVQELPSMGELLDRHGVATT